MKEEKLFTEIGTAIKGAEVSQMFGKPALKVKGKAFACFFENEMVFKITGDEHASAIMLSGAKLFDPSKMGRVMKEWVQVPFKHNKEWKALALAAFEYVKKNAK